MSKLCTRMTSIGEAQTIIDCVIDADATRSARPYMARLRKRPRRY